MSNFLYGIDRMPAKLSPRKTLSTFAGFWKMVGPHLSASPRTKHVRSRTLQPVLTELTVLH